MIRKKLREKIKQSMPDDMVYVLVGIPRDGSSEQLDAFVEHDERINPYEVIGILEFGKSIVLASAESE